MNIKLDKDDLITLVKGSEPNYSVMDHPLISKYGNFNGSYGKWSWDTYLFKGCSEEDLLKIYQLCKDSW